MFENAAYVLIESVNGFAKSPIKIIERRDRVLIEGSSFHVVDPVNAIASFADPARLGGVVFFRIRHCFGIIDFFSLIFSMVALGGLERIVDGLKGEVHHKGCFLVTAVAFEPRDRLISEAIGSVAFLFMTLSVDIKGLIKVGTLSLERDPVVESFARSIIVMAHMPFADHGSTIA